MQQIDRLIVTEDRWNKVKINEKTQNNSKCPGCGQSFELRMRYLESESACGRPESAKTTALSPFPEVGWQQPSEKPVNHHKLDKKRTNLQATLTKRLKNLKKKQITDAASQMSP